MRNIAIIPARAGSKGVLNKNIKPLAGGLSLTHRAIKSAIEAKCFKDIILTTDIKELISEFKKSEKIKLRERPQHLASDGSTMIPVILDCLDHFEVPDDTWIWLLQPTSPFREPYDFFNIERILDSELAASVISVENKPSHHPIRYYTISNQGYLSPILGKFAQFENRQSLKTCYHRNGCFYVANVREFRRQKSFFLSPCKPYVMSVIQSVGIDEPLDWDVAEMMIKKGYVK